MSVITKQELTLIKDALESGKAEFEQLILDNEWFVTNVIDLQESALEILYGYLGLHPEEEDDEYELR